MMKILLGTTVGLLVASAAQAADMPIKAPPVAAPPPFSWTGFYIGAHIGGGWGDGEHAIPFFDGDTDPFVDSSHTISGFLGGGQAGINWQVSPWLVLGVEGQISGTDMRGNSFCFVGFRCRTEVNFVASLAGRVGFASDRTMYYVKAGGAWADTDITVTDIFDPTLTASGSRTRSGFMVGAGVEHAFLPNWSAKIEYNFMEFNRDTDHFDNNNGFCDLIIRDCRDDIRQHIHLIKFGINYRFSWGVPGVAARY